MSQLGDAVRCFSNASVNAYQIHDSTDGVEFNNRLSEEFNGKVHVHLS